LQVNGVAPYRKQQQRLKDVLQIMAGEDHDIQQEQIEGYSNIHLFFANGIKITIGPFGGLWRYLTPAQREVHPNIWDAGQRGLKNWELAAELERVRRR
jgi:hypothetical protein